MYKQVARESTYTIEIKRSEFITTLVPITTAEDAEEKLRVISKKYSDATHNCYAYIANENASVMRFSDDGEPQGTAGIPMLEVLKRRGLSKTLAVVTRYFGGVKLGAAGLVSAYTQAVCSALDNTSILVYKESNLVDMNIEYGDIKGVSDIVSANSGKIIEIDYQVDVKIKCAIPMENYSEFVNKINDYTQGKVELVVDCKRFVAY